MYQKILVGLDGSEAANHALTHALRIATLMQAQVCAVSVEERLPAYAATVAEMAEEEEYEHSYFAGVQNAARRLAAGQGIALSSKIVPGHAAQVLVEVARTGSYDLIVIGHTGHSRLHNLFMGSTADRVVESATCPVLVVR
jgi:nucleotide-binding universal stress UspA family protein